MSPKDPKADALHDKAKKLGTKKRDLLSRLKHVRQAISAVRKRRSKLHSERKHVTSSKDPIAFDTCPVSPVMDHVLHDCRDAKIPFGVISADRRDGIAQKFGHASQKELFDKWQAGVPGFLPANAPGHSTHEYRDGPNSFPYGSPDGSELKEPWKLGLDLRSNDEATKFCKDAAALGYQFWQPYPTTSEAHHVNLKANPIPTLIRRGKL